MQWKHIWKSEDGSTLVLTAIGMVAIIAFHILISLLATAILVRLIPQTLVVDALGYLHSTVGITTPPAPKARAFALVWLASTVVIVDGCLALLFFITKLLN